MNDDMAADRQMIILQSCLPRVQKKHCLLMGKYLSLDWVPALIYKQYELNIYQKELWIKIINLLLSLFTKIS